ncbi:MAG: alpha-L-arabinofuranosidase C-terminal domain-containing protein [Prevotellaceae bacterium]|nr:alpha-L-arabinofuranosidase C-terminal domain-containing protein [Prevotellaceae bacterium]MDO4931214.1 alpha-L-arabinofuranosidase C-terminal domain-containing protein [Prevotellaceae bacterium]
MNISVKKFGLYCAMSVFSAASSASDGAVGNGITAVSDAPRIQYNHMIFGQFIEHFHTQIYGGIYDPGSRFADADGFRSDVIAALKEIKTPIVRWPGGCFVSTYHWLDGVGDKRTPVYDKSWQVEDPNTFGTDEYIKWCRKVGTEPYICTNAGTGTPEEMSDWVEYCNLSIGKYGRMRMANGHEQPYNVKYWSVGNENYGDWELGAKTVKDWGPLVCESAKLIRSVTRDAKLFAAGRADRAWTLPLLKAAGRHLDYISLHGYYDPRPLYHYNTPSPYMDCMMQTGRPEREILETVKILEEAGLRGKIKIAFDEWNLRYWHHPWHGDLRKGFEIEARNKNDENSTYTMADALFSACFLNTCLRNSADVEIACFSPIVNTRGAIFVHPNGIVKRTTFHTFSMYTNLLEDWIVPVAVTSENLTEKEQRTPVIDGILTSNSAGTRYVYAIVNKDPQKGRSVRLDLKVLPSFKGKKVKGVILQGSSTDDYNDIGSENRVTPQERQYSLKDGSVILPPHSINFLYIE